MAKYTLSFSKPVQSDHNQNCWDFQNNHIETTKIFSARSSSDPPIFKEIAILSSPNRPKLTSVLLQSDPVLIRAHLWWDVLQLNFISGRKLEAGYGTFYPSKQKTGNVGNAGCW